MWPGLRSSLDQEAPREDGAEEWEDRYVS
jgi:hypothetical protein